MFPDDEPKPNKVATVPDTMMDPALTPGEEVGCGGKSSGWDDVAQLGPERLCNLYLNWRAGQISSLQIQVEYGPSVLEALHAEHLIYMNGDLFYAATKHEREDTRPSFAEGRR